jgi:hypothetical protein
MVPDTSTRWSVLVLVTCQNYEIQAERARRRLVEFETVYDTPDEVYQSVPVHIHAIFPFQ